MHDTTLRRPLTRHHTPPSTNPQSHSRSLSRDSYYSDGGADGERKNRAPRGNGDGGGRRYSSGGHQGQGGKHGGSGSGGAGREGKKGGRLGREDGEATVAALKEVLGSLKGINEGMPDHQGFLPEELAARVNCPDPALWQEVYTEARIRPNKSNRLYRSRVLYLIAYLERRLGFPFSRPPFSTSRRSGGGGGGGGRYGGDRDGGRGRFGGGDREGGRPGLYGRGGASEAGGLGDRDRRGSDRYSSSSRRGDWEEGGRRGQRGGGEHHPQAQQQQQWQERESEAVEEQMESVEPTPFLAIHHLPRYWSFWFLSYLVDGLLLLVDACGLVSSSSPISPSPVVRSLSWVRSSFGPIQLTFLASRPPPPPLVLFCLSGVD